MSRTRFGLSPTLLISLAAGLLWGLLAWQGVTEPAERQLYDFRLRAQPRPEPHPDIVLVAIDDDSLNFIGTWPWPRDIQAQLVDRLRMAKGVMWDIILGDPSLRHKDEALARAMHRQGNMVLAAGASNTSSGGQAYGLPERMFSDAAADYGWVRYVPDPDGVVRGASALLAQPLDNGQLTLPMLHFAFARQIRPDLQPPAGKVFFNFHGDENTYPRVVAWKTLVGRVPPEYFQDKYVVVGATAQGLNDRLTMPFGVLSGVLYNAQAAVSWVREDWRRPLPPWATPLAAALTAFLTVWLWEAQSAGTALVLITGLLASAMAADNLAFDHWQTWLPLATILLAATSTVLVLGIGHQVALAWRIRVAISRLFDTYRQRQLSLTNTQQLDGTLAKRLPLTEQVSALLSLAGAISEERTFFQALIATNQNPVLVCDDGQNVILSNPAARTLFGEAVATGNLQRTLADEADAVMVEAYSEAFAQSLVTGQASPQRLLHWRGSAYQLTFLKMSAVNGALCLFEDVTHLHRRANTDGLTGLWNRRYFDEQLAMEVARCHRYPNHNPVSLVMIDVDHFKAFNDTYGHQLGDEVLIKVAATLQQLVRGTDLAVRYGGEEMALILPHTRGDGALILAERVRQAIADLALADASGQAIRVTASFGVAVARPDDSPEALIARADKALYRSKESGRNRVTLAAGDDVASADEPIRKH